jgi:hypothetical protein
MADPSTNDVYKLEVLRDDTLELHFFQARGLKDHENTSANRV